MKKLITTLALASIATGVFAQGAVSWYNYTGGITTNNVLSPFSSAGTLVATTAGKAAVAGYYFTVLYDTSSTPANNNPLNAAWSQVTTSSVPLIGQTALAVGDMQGPEATGTYLADNWAAGTAGAFIIVGWSANLGTTWAAVSAELAANWATLNPNIPYFFGVTAVNTATPTASPSPAAALWTIAGGTMPLDEVVGPVPEPTTMALAALGGASLLLFRRKK